MELAVSKAINVPEDHVLSFRFGELKRQVQVEKLKRHNLKFPVGADAFTEPMKIELLQVVASARIVLKPAEAAYSIPLAAAPGSTSCIAGRMGLDLRVRWCGGTPAVPELPFAASASPNGSLSVQTVEEAELAEPPTPLLATAEYKDAANLAREYLEHHGLLRYVQALLHAVIQSKPSDPYLFMLLQLQAQHMPNKPDYYYGDEADSNANAGGTAKQPSPPDMQEACSNANAGGTAKQPSPAGAQEESVREPAPPASLDEPSRSLKLALAIRHLEPAGLRLPVVPKQAKVGCGGGLGDLPQEPAADATVAEPGPAAPVAEAPVLPSPRTAGPLLAGAAAPTPPDPEALPTVSSLRVSAAGTAGRNAVEAALGFMRLDSRLCESIAEPFEEPGAVAGSVDEVPVALAVPESATEFTPPGRASLAAPAETPGGGGSTPGDLPEDMLGTPLVEVSQAPPAPAAPPAADLPPDMLSRFAVATNLKQEPPAPPAPETRPPPPAAEPAALPPESGGMRPPGAVGFRLSAPAVGLPLPLATAPEMLGHTVPFASGDPPAEAETPAWDCSCLIVDSRETTNEPSVTPASACQALPEAAAPGSRLAPQQRASLLRGHGSSNSLSTSEDPVAGAKSRVRRMLEDTVSDGKLQAVLLKLSTEAPEAPPSGLSSLFGFATLPPNDDTGGAHNGQPKSHWKEVQTFGDRRRPAGGGLSESLAAVASPGPPTQVREAAHAVLLDDPRARIAGYWAQVRTLSRAIRHLQPEGPRPGPATYDGVRPPLPPPAPADDDDGTLPAMRGHWREVRTIARVIELLGGGDGRAPSGSDSDTIAGAFGAAVPLAEWEYAPLEAIPMPMFKGIFMQQLQASVGALREDHDSIRNDLGIIGLGVDQLRNDRQRVVQQLRQ